MRPRVRPAALLAAAILALAGCRPLVIETEPGPAYMVDVQNRLNQSVTVHFDDGTGARFLGTVGADVTERFVVAAPARRDVQIIATSQDGTRQVRRDIVLEPGQAVGVQVS